MYSSDSFLDFAWDIPSSPGLPRVSMNTSSNKTVIKTKMDLPSISKCLYLAYLSVIVFRLIEDGKTRILNGGIAINRAVFLAACVLGNCHTMGSVARYDGHHFPLGSYQIHIIAQLIISYKMSKQLAG